MVPGTPDIQSSKVFVDPSIIVTDRHPTYLSPENSEIIQINMTLVELLDSLSFLFICDKCSYLPVPYKSFGRALTGMYYF
jgi:hypothetical protein